MHDRTRAAASPALAEAIGQSDAFLAFQEALSRVARVDRPVLLAGERGTGKELAAARLHYLSPRWQGPLVVLDCAALAPTLAEAELFGHEAGAFTGAAARRAGRFERADGGTLFLDEVGNIPAGVQDKLLRVVEYGMLERVGGTQPVRVDARVVAATNADLPAMVARGLFRADLLDRLSFEVLAVPPLRERGDDVILLARHFAASMAAELDLPDTPELAPAALAQLLAHPWPGNVRELRNAVERAVARLDDGGMRSGDRRRESAGAGGARPAGRAPRIEHFDLDPFARPWRQGPAVPRPAPATQPPPSTGAMAGGAGPRRGPGTAPPDDARPDGTSPHDARPVNADPVNADPVNTGPCNAHPGAVGAPSAIGPPLPCMPLPEAIRQLELSALRAALDRARHNRRVAAELLGISYDQFRGLYRRHRQDMET
ncbi:sigma 54-interacting transcriptional regulator [Nitratidesulfovibrio sp. SRB-5]|uniref:sigma 54-interacting transcriptional regulator n=1 Tax=Nitratidesulfovibrio sp. SRB-5 TaxID=2872636 RepID=UPI001027804A|nr:sigma 54-interacting transcriptional regulator [Nitratidesulfovibrio sp. SRB-5]MBZ2172042.1 sigma 54-interacting transcriptional regulator [Nitratidesulfovibrio sp. SRB-5]RXF77551.1 transcriptional regulator [Desulfovibrio sp. DS-1]